MPELSFKADRLVRLPEAPWERREWIGQAGDWQPAEAEAAIFRFKSSPTQRERLAIDRLTHEIAGGFEVWLDMQQQAARLQAVVYANLAAEIWPEGRPDAAGDPAARQGQADALQAAWGAYDGADKAHWALYQTMVERVAFLATWQVLWIGGPLTFQALADSEVEPETLYLLWNRHQAAVEETWAGKGKPSGS